MQHVLLIAQQLIPSAILCGHSQLEHLAEKGIIEYEFCRSQDITADKISRADTIVLVRGALGLDLLAARTAKRTGKRLVYVLDDDLLNVPEYIVSYGFYGSRITKKTIRKIMACCSCLASPSPVLIQKYGNEFEETVIIEEPALPHRQNHFEVKDTVNIVFAGSLDRTSDIEALLSNALRRIKSEYGDAVEITFFGARPDIVEELGLKYIGYCTDYYEYMETMSLNRFDIGLAPMVSSEFSRCKHYNKYVEYSSYGIVGIYSNVYPYTEAVRNGENGILCSNNENEWYEAISGLIANPGKRAMLRKCCVNEADTVYSLDTAAENYLRIVGETVCEKADVRRFRFWIEKKINSFGVLVLRGMRLIKRTVSGLLKKKG